MERTLDTQPQPEAVLSAPEWNLPLPAPDYLTQLSEAFRAFSEGADRMKQMYAKLEKRVVYLTDELEKKNRELERANRLAALGELAAGVAHEIRNPLCGIELSATLLQRELSVSDERSELVENIVEGVRRLDTIVSNLLTFTRDQKIQPRECDLNRLVEETIQAVEFNRTKYAVEIQFSRRARNGGFFADADQLRQVFVNIALNGIEAMSDSDVRSLTFTVKRQTDRQGREWMFVSARDTGEGICRQNLERIFDPFFSTKDSGTGLGLSISHRIVEAHGGAIRVRSRIGKGTTFWVSLPCVPLCEMEESC